MRCPYRVIKEQGKAYGDIRMDICVCIADKCMAYIPAQEEVVIYDPKTQRTIGIQQAAKPASCKLIEKGVQPI